ncbi:ABC transporter ATP-binding protein [Streptomyces sp. NPDC051555]|uniref:ABC transporter ATP-binding protein n=1 Tax=Streptomyces sp. NPDC051555 TaxID=3365657 RepID=UPI00379EC996
MNRHLVPRPGSTALEAVDLGHRYRRGWALNGCSLRVPAGRVCALVGPNGAGKSTFLSLAGGLLAPSSGSVRVFGADAGSPRARATTALLSQDKPLYRGFRVSEILRMGAALNPSWDEATAHRIVDAGSIPLKARVSSLSGGQRTRVALALAFGKRPRLLMLDEPMSDLDPLVRHEIAGLLRDEAATHGTTVVLSSHVVGELVGLCDYLAVINAGTVRLAGPVGELIAGHSALANDAPHPPGSRVAQLPSHALTITRRSPRTPEELRAEAPDARADAPSLEHLLMAYLLASDAHPYLASDARPLTRPDEDQ